MKAKLKLDTGWEIEVEVPDEVIKQLKKKEVKCTGYERVNDDETYYYELYDGTIDTDTECYSDSDNECYEAGNYYSDKTVAEHNARATVLMRKLRRFAVEHRVKDFDWTFVDQSKYYIYYVSERKEIMINESFLNNIFGTIYFDSVETAKLAIDTFKDELIWYFTEYKDSAKENTK